MKEAAHMSAPAEQQGSPPGLDSYMNFQNTSFRKTPHPDSEQVYECKAASMEAFAVEGMAPFDAFENEEALFCITQGCLRWQGHT
eukprot:4964506-Amphidinium_carterae.1